MTNASKINILMPWGLFPHGSLRISQGLPMVMKKFHNLSFFLFKFIAGRLDLTGLCLNYTGLCNSLDHTGLCLYIYIKLNIYIYYLVRFQQGGQVHQCGHLQLLSSNGWTLAALPTKMEWLQLLVHEWLDICSFFPPYAFLHYSCFVNLFGLSIQNYFWNWLHNYSKKQAFF